jgi:hypothetical protein
MHLAVVVIQGLLELGGLGAFVGGYFSHSWWLLVVGGCLIILDDVVEIALGILNPLFPIVLAVILGIAMTPWYVGVFWGTAAFKVLGVPTALRKVLTPKRMASVLAAHSARQRPAPWDL